ncbi:hypothetical protein TD95_001514 [Thielaviopsis punctulata]|uniref:Rhamnogalacturonase A/B/Epimerase-like pectate lyase domain-containing protein n=1 Tax=Thielaviopsis punctulata TaxID=72032 RepID=A0A0F4ZIU0_9PEZI|nr:hypothetical protein TD95_001514 [Thielaviopsis punctulata]
MVAYNALFSWATVLILLLLLDHVSAVLNPDTPGLLPHQRRALRERPLYKRQTNSSTAALDAARKIIDAAVAQQGEYNTHRIKNPKRNTYRSRYDASGSQKRDDGPAPPVLNSTVLEAAALLAEHHALQQQANGTLHTVYSRPKFDKRSLNETEEDQSTVGKRDTSYWLADLGQHGRSPLGGDPSYPVFRNVQDPKFAGGAKGDGVTDDTAAINGRSSAPFSAPPLPLLTLTLPAAIAYGNNCGDNCLSSSIKGTFIYFPPGTYLISAPINAYYYSQLVGNPNDMAVIKTSPGFIGLGAIQSDVYMPNANGDEWYIEQSNFYRQVRNFIVDISDTTTASTAAFHWQVAQATSMFKVSVYASTASDTTQMGFFTENGSGGFMSDVDITGGKYGIYGGNQQYTVRNFYFEQQTAAAICLLWDWGWTWSGLLVSDTPIGLLLIDPTNDSAQPAGSIYVMDSYFKNVETLIKSQVPKSSILETSGITLDNIGMSGVSNVVLFENGDGLAIPTSSPIDFVVIDSTTWGGSPGFGSFFQAYTNRTRSFSTPAPSSSLLGQGRASYARETYFYRARPQYEGIEADSIVNVLDYGAVGDGVADDTAAVQKALDQASLSNVIFFPAGSYRITSTITIPLNCRMTGQVWSQLVASGSEFQNTEAPTPMVKVGNVGDVGTIEISDILFTSIGNLAGLVMVEWNVAAETQGSVAMWDSHFRVGGAMGTELQVAQCPKVTDINLNCIAAAMMMHLTPLSNGYFENVWAWVADHDLDDSQNTMITIAVARGILVESSGPTWLWGTASEHSMLYQYNFFGAANLFAGMIQTESPYFQYTKSTESPGPFNKAIYVSDPGFDDSSCNGTELLCNFAWAAIVDDVDNITIAGAGLYSWFDAYDQSVCVDAQNCQQRLILDNSDNYGFRLSNLVTIGSMEMLSAPNTNTAVLAKENTQAAAHPFWSYLGIYTDDMASDNNDDDKCADDDTRPECSTDPICPDVSFSDLDAVFSAGGQYSDYCLAQYVMDTMNATLGDVIANYTEVNQGYDSVYKYYPKYIKELVTESLTDFMQDSTAKTPGGGAGNKYFQCKFTSGKASATQQCPFSYLQLAPYGTYTMEYNLIDSDGFYSALNSTYGIQKDWVEFGQKKYSSSACNENIYNMTTHNAIKCPTTWITYENIPVLASHIQITNPKTVVEAAMSNISQLQDTFDQMNINMATASWNGPPVDAVQTLSIALFTLMQGIENMAAAKAIASKMSKEKRIELILGILSVALIFLPFLDDVVPEIAGLESIGTMISTMGNVALSIESIVANPLSAPMEIIGALMGPEGREEKGMEDLSSARRLMPDGLMGKFGGEAGRLEGQMTNLFKKACSA